MNGWADRTVVVTGAGGFIGSRLTERLVELGARPRAFVHYRSDGTAGWLEQSAVRAELEVHLGDLRDPDSLRAAFADVDTVFHLGALVGIPYSYRTPLAYVRTNVEGTLNVLDAAMRAGARRVVHTSTSEVYGTAMTVPMDESHPLQGQSPYSASKIGADKVAESFHRSFDLPLVVVRPFNTFGPRQSARAVIPTIISQVLAGRDVALGNLNSTRDFTFVDDTAEAFVLAGSADGAIGEVFNLGTGREVTIVDLARMIAGMIGSDSGIVVDRKRLRPAGSEVDRLCADASKARTVLEWAPTKSLEAGLAETIAWMADNAERYRPDVYGL